MLELVTFCAVKFDFIPVQECMMYFLQFKTPNWIGWHRKSPQNPGYMVPSLDGEHAEWI